MWQEGELRATTVSSTRGHHNLQGIIQGGGVVGWFIVGAGGLFKGGGVYSG